MSPNSFGFKKRTPDRRNSGDIKEEKIGDCADAYTSPRTILGERQDYTGSFIFLSGNHIAYRQMPTVAPSAVEE